MTITVAYTAPRDKVHSYLVANTAPACNKCKYLHPYSNRNPPGIHLLIVDSESRSKHIGLNTRT